MDIQKVMAEMKKYLPALPAVRLKAEKGEPGLFDSKLGGTPYFPKDMEYPMGKTNAFRNQPLIMLAQLNFDELPHIPDFPEKGMLQFFIAADDLYGMASGYGEEMTAQNNFRVIYHETIIKDESCLLRPEEIPQYSGEDELLLPFSGSYRLTACQAETLPATACDYRFEEAFVRCYNEQAEEPIEALWDLDDETAEQIYTDADSSFHAIIGGYPVFAQDDPRLDEALSDCDTLLFELNSVYDAPRGIDIMWGDMGTGAFMIPRKNLRELDFSRVLYNYDCS